MQHTSSSANMVPPQPSGANIPLQCRGLTKYYGKSKLAVAGVDLEVKKGEVLALFGPDGAGKTTLLQMVAGVIKPTSGTVTIYGEGIKTARRRCGYVAQQFTFSGDLSVKENMQYAADLHAVPRDVFGTRCEQLLEMVGLARFEGRLASKLSGGMKEKLAIACALISDPQVLLLDEPTTGVDPLGRREIQHMLVELSRKGTSVILATSDLDEVEIADRIAFMQEGKLDEGALTSVLHDREHSMVRKSVARQKISTGVPRLDLTKKRSAELAPSQPASQQSPAATLQRIDVAEVVKKFGAFTAVNGISFSVRSGEIFGLLGANGAGKTTAIQMLCGLQRPTSGAVRILGKDPRGADSKRVHARMGYMNQRFSLYDGLTVLENIDFYAWSYGISSHERKQKLAAVIDRLDLGSIRNELVARLPRGWKQRVAFAAATLHEPDILFLDEPTAGTDSKTRQLLWTLTNAFADAGAAVLVTTHFLDEAEFCDRLALMVAGKFVGQGSPTQVRQNCPQRAITLHAPHPQEVSHALGQQFEAWRLGLHPDFVRVLSYNPEAELPQIRQLLQSQNVEFSDSRIELCTLEEAFIAAISESRRPDG